MPEGNTPLPKRIGRFLEAITDVDLTKVPPQEFASNLHPDVEWDVTHIMGIPDETTIWHGRDGVVSGWYRWLEQWDDYRFRADNITQLGEYIVIDVHVEARGRASGAPVVMSQVQAWLWRDGKVFRVQAFPDHQTALEALEDGAG